MVDSLPAPKRLRRIVLASASPRRRRLLSWLSMTYDTVSVDTPERLDGPLAEQPELLAEHLAAEKARAAAEEGHAHDALVLCFDTIVVHNGSPLGKPADAADARRMLRALSGRVHQVVTGVAILWPAEAVPETFSVTTDVRMRELDDVGIAAWMASGEYLGCAGAYNIEAQIASVDDDECFQNVAGAPLCHLYAALKVGATARGVDLGLQSPVAPCDAALRRTCRLVTDDMRGR